MELGDVGRERLANHGLSKRRFARPEDAVAWMGALQAQDYAASLWAVGVRTGATRADVEDAIAEARIVRTWPMRGTLHVVAAADVRWMLDLMAPRAIAKAAGRARQLEIDSDVVSAARAVIERALRDRSALTRAELYALMAANGIEPTGQRGIHVIGRLAHEGVLCVGPRRGKDPTFVLLDSWVPMAAPLERDAALAELATRYFTSHGPATERDLAWWSGLTLADVRAGIALAGDALSSEHIAGTTYVRGRGSAGVIAPAGTLQLLPGFDEFVLGYSDRSVVLPQEHANRIVPGGNGIFFPTVVVDGRVVGTWRRRVARGLTKLQITAFEAMSPTADQPLAEAAHEYGHFLGSEVELD